MIANVRSERNYDSLSCELNVLIKKTYFNNVLINVLAITMPPKSNVITGILGKHASVKTNHGCPGKHIKAHKG